MRFAGQYEKVKQSSQEKRRVIMTKVFKKATVSLMLFALLVSQTGCLELWWRYPSSSTTSYMTNYRVQYYAQAYTLAMLTGITPFLILPGSSTAHSFVLPPPAETLLTYSILATLSTAYAFNGFGSTGNTIGSDFLTSTI